MLPETIKKLIDHHLAIADIHLHEGSYTLALSYCDIARQLAESHPDKQVQNDIAYREVAGFLLQGNIDEALNLIDTLRAENAPYPHRQACEKVDAYANAYLERTDVTISQKVTCLSGVVEIYTRRIPDATLREAYTRLHESYLQREMIGRINAIQLDDPAAKEIIHGFYPILSRLSVEELHQVDLRIRLNILAGMLKSRAPLDFDNVIFLKLVESAQEQDPFQANCFKGKYHHYRAENYEAEKSYRCAYAAAPTLYRKAVVGYDYAKALAKECRLLEAIELIERLIKEIDESVRMIDDMTVADQLAVYREHLARLNDRYQGILNRPSTNTSMQRNYSSEVTGAIVLDLDNTVFFFQNGQDGFADMERIERYAMSDSELEGFYNGSFNAWMNLLREARQKGFKIVPLTARNEHPIGNRTKRGFCPLVDHFMEKVLAEGLVRREDFTFTNGQDKAAYLSGIADRFRIPNKQLIYLDDQSALIETARHGGFTNAIHAMDLTNELTYAFTQMFDVVRRRMDGISANVCRIRASERERASRRVSLAQNPTRSSLPNQVVQLSRERFSNPQVRRRAVMPGSSTQNRFAMMPPVSVRPRITGTNSSRPLPYTGANTGDAHGNFQRSSANLHGSASSTGVKRKR